MSWKQETKSWPLCSCRIRDFITQKYV